MTTPSANPWHQAVQHACLNLPKWSRHCPSRRRTVTPRGRSLRPTRRLVNPQSDRQGCVFAPDRAPASIRRDAKESSVLADRSGSSPVHAARYLDGAIDRPLLRKPDLHHLRWVRWLTLRALSVGRQLDLHLGQRVAQQDVWRGTVSHQARDHLVRVVGLIPYHDPSHQWVRAHRIGMDGPRYHCVDDLVPPVRVRFGGRGGSGFQLAIALTQSRAAALSLIPGKWRRSSTTADNSPLSSNT
jgi:hypothetical protein